MTFALISVVCLLALAFVMAPLRAAKTGVGATQKQMSRAQIEYSIAGENADLARHRLLEKRASLRRQSAELEFDRTMDKLNAEDYEALRDKFASESADVEAKLGEKSASNSMEDASADFDLEAEVLVARARRKRAVTTPYMAASIEAWACACGRTMSIADKFCASCGASRPASSN